MSQELLKKVQGNYMALDRPNVQVGDTVVVHTIIRDGEKKRIQKFQGMIIAVKNAGTDKTFTVRKISYGVGVEKIFPLYSTNIETIEVLKHANVRRSKLYYMRDRIGKAAMKLKPGKAIIPQENATEVVEEVTADVADTLVNDVSKEEVVENVTAEKADGANESAPATEGEKKTVEAA